tara:strand:- start:762 stop:911 length:150 start_codon:yes stop_codon:yes gene_type:complete
MKTTGYGKTQRRKLVSKEIKYCTNKGTQHKKCVAMALNMYPKKTKLLLA